MLMVDSGTKWYHVCFKVIYGSKENSWGQCLILLVIILFFGKNN